jgi:hypothetical protein
MTQNNPELDNLHKEMLEDESALLRIQHEATKAAHEAVRINRKMETIQTRARDELHSYIKAVADHYFGSMTGFHELIAKYYLEEKPWTRPGWVWLFPKSTYSYAGGVSTIKGGWRQYNITLPVEPVNIAQQIREAHAEVQAGNPQISLASFFKSKLVWAIANYLPPKKRGIEGAKETEHVSRNLLG